MNFKQRKTKNSTAQAVPVTQEPYPPALRTEIAALVRDGGEIVQVEDLGHQFYRIHYTYPAVTSVLFDAVEAVAV